MVGLVGYESWKGLTFAVDKAGLVRLHLAVRGAVQGVGFRPFVYRLAVEMGLKGWVLNSSQGVFIEAEGERGTLEKFAARLIEERPPRSYIQGMETAVLDPVGFSEFKIRESDSAGSKSALVIPDIATCPECASEIFDPADRRYLYPFTNCTNCGPRFSIIHALPYDRPNTTMAGFEMCDGCRTEYENPSDRRFHAQPNACPSCGPHLELWAPSGRVLETRNGALLQTAEAIRDGKIVALKGMGGFQLLVDARNDDAVMRLRARKHREEKPFALMYPSLEAVRKLCEVADLEERLLLSPEAPIVILRSPTLTRLSPFIAPRNPYLGIMLPYTPLHLILMRQLGFPVVATSGNVSDEPICIDEHDALERLAGIADLFLVHDRPVERQVDDSVVRVMAGRIQVVRRARGYAPFPIELDESCETSVLAVGGHLKSTVAVNLGSNVFVSQHIGDLSTEGARRAFGKVVSDFQNLYEVLPEIIVHDLHPDYSSTQFAGKAAGEKLAVQHHLAHVAACMAENKLKGDVLGVSWDGTGFGEDGNIWGGEFLLTDGWLYERRATFRSFKLPGSTASIKEPRRTAIGVLYEIFGEKLFGMTELAPVRAFDKKSLGLLRKMLESDFNSPSTTSAGRLFDAVSSIVGITQVVNFEGKGAMELEFAADGVKHDESYDFDFVIEEKQEAGNRKSEVGGRKSEVRGKRSTGRDGIEKESAPCLAVDWEPMVRSIVAEASSGEDIGRISAKFHNTLVEIIVEVSRRVGRERVVLSGGCFQNKYLTERTVARLTDEGFKPYWHQRVPPNDGGISLGQMYVAMKRMKRNNEIVE